MHAHPPADPDGTRLLWIARTCPYPPNDGEKLRVFNLLKALSSRYSITLVYRVMDESEHAAAAALSPWCSGGVHGVAVPRPSGMVDRLRWALPFVFSKYPLSLCTVFFRPILRQLQALADQTRFDLVQVEHSSLAIYLDHLRLQGTPPTVLTLHNIDHVRFERVLQNTPAGLMRLYHRVNLARFRRWELQSLAGFAQLVTMSDLDSALLVKAGVQRPIAVVANGVDVHGVPFQLPPATAVDLVFVASMDSDANHDGAMFFIREIWPRVRQAMPSLRLLMVGRRPQPELQAQHNGRDIVVTGMVDDVLAYYRQAAVAIVPLRSGGGTRLKILEAMAAGTPVVSTTVGCEGLAVVPDQHLLVADRAQDFAAAVLRLVQAPAERDRLAANARGLVEDSYDWAALARRQEAVYDLALEQA